MEPRVVARRSSVTVSSVGIGLVTPMALILAGPGRAPAAPPDHGRRLPTPPPGWTLEVVAEAPAVSHPSVVCSAPDGRVFVAEDPMDIRTPRADLAQGRIRCLHPDGRITTFADGLHAVFGMQYLDGKLYVLHNRCGGRRRFRFGLTALGAIQLHEPLQRIERAACRNRRHVTADVVRPPCRPPPTMTKYCGTGLPPTLRTLPWKPMVGDMMLAAAIRTAADLDDRVPAPLQQIGMILDVLAEQIAEPA